MDHSESGKLPKSTASISDEDVRVLLIQAYESTKPEDWSPEQPCHLCGGLGCITLDIQDVGHPLYGRAFTCPCQRNDPARIRRIIDKMFDNRIPDSHRAFTFQSWYALSQEKLQGKTLALGAAHKFVENAGTLTMKATGTKKTWLVLSGDFGVGKTSLAVAMALAFIEKGSVVLYTDTNALIDRVQDSYGADYHGPSRSAMINAIVDAEVVFLDDVGDIEDPGQASRDVRRMLYAVIDRRHKNSRTTVITTNLNREAFKRQFGGRIFRRVMERALWIDVRGIDLTDYGDMKPDQDRS